jgi:hypothetical protein
MDYRQELQEKNKEQLQSESSKFEVTPEGKHIAKIYLFAMLGVMNTGFKNKDGSDKFQLKALMMGEFPSLMMSNGTPYGFIQWLTITTASKHNDGWLESNLYKWYDAKDDIEKLGTVEGFNKVNPDEYFMGKTLEIKVKHKLNPDGSIKKATYLPTDREVEHIGTSINPQCYYNIYTYENEYDKLPQWIKDKYIEGAEGSRSLTSGVNQDPPDGAVINNPTNQISNEPVDETPY